MEQHALVTELGHPPTTSIYLTAMTWLFWGRDLSFSCEADGTPFEMHFRDCRETRWQLYSHISSDTPTAFPRTELVNFKRGRDQHRSPAHLLTGHFGLSLVYGALEIRQG